MSIEGNARSLPNAAAIAFLKNKQQIRTAHWDEMLGETHAKSFTVAGAVKVALLNDLHQAVNDSIEQGQSIGEFRKSFDRIVAKHGWTYKGKRGWRTRIIYDTNMRAANQAAKWSRIQESKKLRPYLQYLTAGDSRVRKKHNEWDKLILPVDHPWWDKHYPANDFGCRCTVRTLSERDLKRKGLVVSDAPDVHLVERVNTKTGEVYPKTPEGVGVGFDYNVGKAWMAEDHLGRMMVKAPLPVQKQFDIVSKQVSKPLQRQFETYSRSIKDGVEPTRKQVAVGYLKTEVVNAVPNLKSATVSISDDVLKQVHSTSEIGEQVKAVVDSLPEKIHSPTAVLMDKSGSIVYVLDSNDRSDGTLTDDAKDEVTLVTLVIGDAVSISAIDAIAREALISAIDEEYDVLL